jgi:hypothetical protein
MLCADMHCQYYSMMFSNVPLWSLSRGSWRIGSMYWAGGRIYFNRESIFLVLKVLFKLDMRFNPTADGQKLVRWWVAQWYFLCGCNVISGSLAKALRRTAGRGLTITTALKKRSLPGPYSPLRNRATGAWPFSYSKEEQTIPTWSTRFRKKDPRTETQKTALWSWPLGSNTTFS